MTPSADNSEVWIAVARIIRPQGRKGEVLADILTDFPDRLAARKHLCLRDPSPAGSSPPRQLQIQDLWLHKGRIVFKFEGIDSITDAETLRGFDLTIPQSERAPLDEDSVYIGDLIGCEVIDERTGAAVGRIVDVDRESTSTPLLVIQSDSDPEILVPFARDYLLSIDLPAKRILMQLPEGLVDLNRR